MTLFVALPPPDRAGQTARAPAGAEYRYAVSDNGQVIASQGVAAASLLPRGKGEVVVILPAQAVSWHLLKLPQLARSTSPARLRAVLEGLLEEQVLDDLSTLHIALEAGRHTGQPAGHAVWAACCDKAWLTQALQQLEQDRLPASRVLPALRPLPANAASAATSDSQAAPAQVVLAGDAEQPWLQISTDKGAWLLPVRSAEEVRQTLAMLGLLPEDAEDASNESPSANPADPVEPIYQAEPAVTALAEKWFPVQPALRPAEQGWLAQFATDDDLAQFDLRLRGSSRTLRRWRKVITQLLYAPQWRPARVGVLVLVAAQLIGLNAWAWMQHRQLESAKQDVRQLLTQAFPQTRAIIDPPLQMAREVAALRQAAGQTSPQDLESMLAALAAVLPAQHRIQHISYTTGELQFSGPALSPEELADAQDKLLPYGLRIQPAADSASSSASNASSKQWTISVGNAPALTKAVSP